MADGTDIDGFDATVQVARGCEPLSPGCTNCFAKRMAHRLATHDTPTGAAYRGLTRAEGNDIAWTGAVRPASAEELAAVPAKWKKPRRILVGTMGDLFHHAVPLSTLDHAFAMFGTAAGLTGEPNRRHLFCTLTKRTHRAAEFIRDWVEFGRRPHGWPDVLPGVMIGTSIENAEAARDRLEPLRDVAARGWPTWVSYEPALGPVDWSPFGFIRFMVAGPESGPGCRPSDPDWHRAARDHCQRLGIPFFYKAAPTLDGAPCRALPPFPA